MWGQNLFRKQISLMFKLVTQICHIDQQKADWWTFLQMYCIFCISLHVLRDGGSQEPEWLHCSHSVVHDGKWGESRGVSPEVHYHLHSFERVKLQVIVTAPDSQLLNLLSVSRFVSVLEETDDCGVICKLQKLDRGVFRCAVICVEIE